MTTLVDSQPTDIVHRDGSVIFYFGVRASSVNQLPGKTEFEVVYSPKDGNGWEAVVYRLFEQRNGMSVVSRRNLEPNEIAYFERLLTKLKTDTGSSPVITDATV
jgi:hypothetical protein